MRPLRRQSRVEEVYVPPEKRNTFISNTIEIANERETSSKVVANWEQTTSKVVAKTSSKLVANGEQSGSIVNENSQTSSKVVAKTSSKLVANGEQSGSKLVAKQNYQHFTGLQKNLIELIYFSCRLNNSKTTKPISIQYITSELQTTVGTVKNAIHRLIDKQIITKKNFKNGRGGWTTYEIDHDIFNEISFFESGSNLVANWKRTSSKVVAQPVAQPVAESLSSSSYINNTTTNYKADALAKIELSESLTRIGFNQGHIDQLLRDSSLSSDIIQSSLDAFAFDLSFEDVKRKVRSPIGLIMKLLKNGQAYISEKGYESEEDRLYRELVDRAEKKKEEKIKLESRMAEIKFEEWLENISDEEKRNLVEPIGEFMGLLHREELKEYFKKGSL